MLPTLRVAVDSVFPDEAVLAASIYYNFYSNLKYQVPINNVFDCEEFTRSEIEITSHSK